MLRLAALQETKLAVVEAAVETYRQVLDRVPTDPHALSALERLGAEPAYEVEIAEILGPLYRNAGDCVLIRIGGDGSQTDPTDSTGESGRGLLEVRCVSQPCRPVDPPLADMIDNGAGGTAQSDKNRYLSFKTGGNNIGRNSKVRVTLADINPAVILTDPPQLGQFLDPSFD